MNSAKSTPLAVVAVSSICSMAFLVFAGTSSAQSAGGGSTVGVVVDPTTTTTTQAPPTTQPVLPPVTSPTTEAPTPVTTVPEAPVTTTTTSSTVPDGTTTTTTMLPEFRVADPAVPVGQKKTAVEKAVRSTAKLFKDVLGGKAVADAIQEVLPEPVAAVVVPAVRTASTFAFPIGLAAAVFAFLVLQQRIDSSDPKLTAAPLAHDDDVIEFR